MDNENPPIRYSYTEPYIIIGVNLKDDFVKHYKQTQYRNTKEGFEQSTKDIPILARKQIADAYTRLREAGWYASGLDKSENIIWRRATATLEIDDSPMSSEEIKEQRKRIRESVIPMIQGMEKCDPTYYDIEDTKY